MLFFIKKLNVLPKHTTVKRQAFNSTNCVLILKFTTCLNVLIEEYFESRFSQPWNQCSWCFLMVLFCFLDTSILLKLF